MVLDKGGKSIRCEKSKVIQDLAKNKKSGAKPIGQVDGNRKWYPLQWTKEVWAMQNQWTQSLMQQVKMSFKE